MDELVFQIEQDAEGAYIACAQGEAIFTEAESLKELRSNVHDAVRCHFAHHPGPKSVRLQFIRATTPAP